MRKKSLVLLVILAMLISLLSMPVHANGANLVTNGSFEDGNTGFTTQYTYLNPANTGDWTLGPPYMYTVGTNPGNYHSAWLPGFAAKDGTKMMIVNGTTTDPAKVVWGQNIALTPYNPVTTIPLYAGQTWEAGEVQLKVVDGKLYVRYLLTDQRGDPDEGWRITGMQVMVAATCAGIAQTNGNPIPGKFPLKLTFSPGVLDTGWKLYDFPIPAGVSFCVAAHANITHAEVGHWETYEFSTRSSVGTPIVGGGTAVESPASTLYPGWTWPGFAGDFDAGTKWIWDPAKMTDAAAGTGSKVEFENKFSIIGTPVSATLKVAADNAFAWGLNGGALTAKNLMPGWETASSWLPGTVVINPMQNSGDSYNGVTFTGPGWSELYSFPVTGLTSGENTLKVTGINATWDVAQWDLVNPGGIIYELKGTSKKWIVDQPYMSETGWGDGKDFTGANWATCICYTRTSPPNYTFAFWAASSYPANPAKLQVTINGSVIGTLDLTATAGEWVQFSKTWNAGTADHALIEIKDLTQEYNGDDFCIDSISFVKQ